MVITRTHNFYPCFFRLKYFIKHLHNIPPLNKEQQLILLTALFFKINKTLGAVRKIRPHSRGCPVWTFADKGVGGSSDADVHTFWRKNNNNNNLRKFIMYPHGQGGRRGWASSDILRTRRKGINLSRFCANVYYGQPLMTCCWKHFMTCCKKYKLKTQWFNHKRHK